MLVFCPLQTRYILVKYWLAKNHMQSTNVQSTTGNLPVGKRHYGQRTSWQRPIGLNTTGKWMLGKILRGQYDWQANYDRPCEYIWFWFRVLFVTKGQQLRKDDGYPGFMCEIRMLAQWGCGFTIGESSILPFLIIYKSEYNWGNPCWFQADLGRLLHLLQIEWMGVIAIGKQLILANIKWSG